MVGPAAISMHSCPGITRAERSQLAAYAKVSVFVSVGQKTRVNAGSGVGEGLFKRLVRSLGAS
jgi:uncharacterized protein (DUF2345 family)